MEPPLPLEIPPNFCELSVDELRHRFQEGILTPVELVSDALERAEALAGHEVFRTVHIELRSAPSLGLRTPILALEGIPYCRPFGSGACDSATDAEGPICIGLAADDGAWDPLIAGKRYDGTWAGTAAAIRGCAGVFGLGVDANGTLAGIVRKSGLAGFRRAAAPTQPSEGCLYRYLIDAPWLGRGLSLRTGSKPIERIRLGIPEGMEEALGPLAKALRADNATTNSPITGTSSVGGTPSAAWFETATIIALPLTETTLAVAETIGLAAVYVPWRPHSKQAMTFQLLAKAGGEEALWSLARHLSGPAAG
jgi:hypothetical protein